MYIVHCTPAADTRIPVSAYYSSFPQVPVCCRYLYAVACMVTRGALIRSCPWLVLCEIFLVTISIVILSPASREQLILERPDWSHPCRVMNWSFVGYKFAVGIIVDLDSLIFITFTTVPSILSALPVWFLCRVAHRIRDDLQLIKMAHGYRLRVQYL